MLKAARLFRNMDSKLELKESDSGAKIIQLKITDKDADFRTYCSEPIRTKGNGISVDEMAKLFGFSRLVARDRLEAYVKEGRLVVDSSVEGVRYYINDIITCVFE